MSLGSRRFCNYPPRKPADLVAALPEALRPQAPQIASITPRRITVYTDRSAYAADHREPRPTDANLTRGIYNGYMSPATKRHIRRSVGTWIRSIWYYRQQIKKRWDPGKPYPVFITLTLPSAQVHDDRVINRQCLQPFLQILRRNHGITHYFWRAEAQENGNVHYHILTDRYIRAEDIQADWNRVINRLGYEDRYYEASGKISPPTTDVHRMTDKIKDKHTGQLISVDPVEYLLDYVTDAAQLEEDQDPMMLGPEQPPKLIGSYRRSDGTVITYTARPVGGRLWGMSDPVREVREPRVECTPQIWGSLHRAADRGELRLCALDHATLFFGDVHATIKRSRGWLGELINSYYLQIFNYLYPGAIGEEWISRHTVHHAPSLWINARTRQLSTTAPDGVADGIEYQATSEPLLITDMRRQLIGPKCTPTQAERLLQLAIKYFI